MNMLNLSAAPHARDKWTTPFIMRMVTLSLLPATIVGILVYGWNAFGIVALAIISAVASEWLFCKACKKPSTIWDGSAVVTGLLLALSLGPQTPLYIPVIGSVFAIVVCKCCFGGLGKNFINPALAARCFLLISFANAMAIKPVVDISDFFTEPVVDDYGFFIYCTVLFRTELTHSHRRFWLRRASRAGRRLSLSA